MGGDLEGRKLLDTKRSLHHRGQLAARRYLRAATGRSREILFSCRDDFFSSGIALPRYTDR
jgi:hypothetical protein